MKPYFKPLIAILLFFLSLQAYSQATFKIKRRCDSSEIVNALIGFWENELDSINVYNFTLRPGKRWGVLGVKWFETGESSKDKKAQLSGLWYIRIVKIDTLPVEGQNNCHNKIKDSTDACYFELSMCNNAGTPYTQLCALHNSGTELIMGVDETFIIRGNGSGSISWWRKKE
jgi:hypothetical protein